MGIRRWARVAGAVGLVAVLLATALPAAQAADASLVFRVVELLRDEHVARPDPVQLYRAALAGLREALQRAGIQTPLADLFARDEDHAREQFQLRFDQAVRAASGRLTERELQFAAARAAAGSLRDSHTGFIPPERLAELRRQQQNEAAFTGIGILLLTKDGKFYARLVFSGSPAQRAGLRPFDRILAIDGVSTEGMTVGDVSSRIRGPQGTAVTLTVRRPGQPAPLVVSVVREPIVVPSVEWAVLDGQVGYVRLGQFNQGSSARLARAVGELQQQGIRGLVLDLRGNPGGFVSELNRVAELFLPRGVVVYTLESREEGRRSYVTRSGPMLDAALPMVVLVDDDTASAAELLSAALRDHGRAPLVGVRTAGAVLVSVTFPLPEGAGLSVAIARMLTPRGEELEGWGIQPDVQVDLTVADLDSGTDSQLLRGLALIRRVLAGGRRGSAQLTGAER
ncbi:MAG: S41 family peptidase [Armatimonadota bacterium]|nr:S41 family peptidase [Armatimonadota bacterium]